MASYEIYTINFVSDIGDEPDMTFLTTETYAFPYNDDFQVNYDRALELLIEQHSEEIIHWIFLIKNYFNNQEINDSVNNIYSRFINIDEDDETTFKQELMYNENAIMNIIKWFVEKKESDIFRVAYFVL